MVTLIVFIVVFGAAVVGMLGQRMLPGHHLAEDSKNAVKVSIGLIATLTALVLGLLVGSVKSSFDAKNDTLRRIAADIVMLDRVMEQYEPETKEARVLLRQMLFLRVATAEGNLKHWADIEETKKGTLSYERLEDILRRLPTTDPVKSQLQQRAVQVGQALAEKRWLMMEGIGSSIPTAFLFVLVFWLGIIFLSFGLFSPANGTVLVIFSSALSPSPMPSF